MSLTGRLVLINSILAAGLAAQVGLSMHVHAGGGPAYAELRQPLETLPMEFQLGDHRFTGLGPPPPVAWAGKTNPRETEIRKEFERMKFTPDAVISRTYARIDAALQLNLYLVYSLTGEDRKHHPEVCIRDVAGAPEDVEARKTLTLGPDGKNRIQRFRFRTGAQNTTVYYWHYTLPRIRRDGETLLQVLHQRGSRAAPSVTAQVSTQAEMDLLDTVENDFLVTLNHALWSVHMPDGTVMDCDRMPIALLRK